MLVDSWLGSSRGLIFAWVALKKYTNYGNDGTFCHPVLRVARRIMRVVQHDREAFSMRFKAVSP